MNSSIEDNEESFAALFEDSFVEFKPMEPGQLLETVIVSISGHSIVIQISVKI